MDSGASLTARDGAGLTPVEAAAQANNNDVVMYLKSAMGERLLCSHGIQGFS